MGSGDRIVLMFTPSLGLGMNVSRFPFALTINIQIANVLLSVGLGKGYDQ